MEGFKQFVSKSKEAQPAVPFANTDSFGAPAITPLEGEIIPPDQPDVPAVQEVAEPMVIDGDVMDAPTTLETGEANTPEDVTSETGFAMTNVSETFCTLCGEEGHSAENCPESHTIPSFSRAILFEEEVPNVESFEDPVPEIDSDVPDPTIPAISDNSAPEIPRIETGL